MRSPTLMICHPWALPARNAPRKRSSAEARFGAFYRSSRYPECRGKWSLRDIQPLT
jgi:hypothetical protein